MRVTRRYRNRMTINWMAVSFDGDMNVERKRGRFSVQKNNPHSSRARVEKIQLILEITVIKIGKYLYDVYPLP